MDSLYANSENADVWYEWSLAELVMRNAAINKDIAQRRLDTIRATISLFCPQ